MRTAIAVMVLGGVILLPVLPATADQPYRTQRQADEVYRRCMDQYPGGWRDERQWSDECLEMAYPHMPARRALRDYYRRHGGQVEQERRRCIEDPQELNTSRCLREAERGRLYNDR